MTKEERQQLIKYFVKDAEKLIADKKLFGRLFSLNCHYEEASQINYTVLVDVLETPKIAQVNVNIANMDTLFSYKDYSTLDENAGIKKKYDQMTLARLRLLRILYEVMIHIGNGWKDARGCFHETLSMHEEIFAEIDSPGIVFYHN